MMVKVNGLRLAYAEWPGERGPIICLPHLTGHKGAFARLAEALAPTYRVLAVDLRGRGESDKPADGYGFAYHARDVLAFADALGIDTFTLVGHSMGATVATYLAAIRPERVSAVVLLDGGTAPEDATMRAMYPAVRRMAHAHASLDHYLRAIQATPFFQPWNRTLAENFVVDAETLPDGSVRPRWSLSAVERDLDLHFFYDPRLPLSAVRCPTLFIRPAQGLFGQQGQVLSSTIVDDLMARLPNARRVDVAGVNHYTLLLNDAPPIVAPVREFLAAVNECETN